jgi:hypothetical protein
MHARWLVLAALAGCFPHQPTLRKAALATEGAMIVGGAIVAAATPPPATTCYSNSDFPYIGTCNTSHSALEVVGPALLIAGLVGIVATIATAEEEPTPPPVRVAPPPRIVGDPGANAQLGVVEAFGLAKRYAAEHAVAIDPLQLHTAVFDAIARQWVFEWTQGTSVRVVAVHESGSVTTSTREL